MEISMPDNVRITEEEIRERLARLYKKGVRHTMEAIADYDAIMARRYPEIAHRSKLYSALKGSSLPERIKGTDEDFPGEDSIGTFLNQVERELKIEK